MSTEGSRWTWKNVARGFAAYVFGAFVAYYVLIIGLAAKKKKVIAEGAIYAAVFSLMIALPTGFLGALPAFLAVGAMIGSGVRSYQLRDLWLPRRGSERQMGRIAHPPPYSQVGSRQYQQIPAQQFYTMPTSGVPQPAPQPVPRNFAQAGPPASQAAAFPTPAPTPAPKPAMSGLPGDLSVSLDWVASTAKRNKHRLPAEAYIAILETSQELDALIDAEQKDPSQDAEFEYELEAMVNRYLPSVLRGYLAIPPSLIEQVQPNGKTPNAELVEQLDLLAGQASALYSSRYSHTTAELSTTGNFLRERFGHQTKQAFDFGVE